LVRCDLAAWYAPHDEVCRSLGLALTHIAEAEQELAIQVAYINGIQIC
jgi:hypothetical protein